MASLYAIRGRDSGRSFELKVSESKIGRDSTSDIQVNDNEVSRQHAILRIANNRFELTDNKSSNGTFVNGQKIESRILANGDRVQVGRTIMVFSSGSRERQNETFHDVEIIGSYRGDDHSQILSSVPSRKDNDDLDSGSSIGIESYHKTDWEIMYLTSRAISRTVDIDQLLSQIMELIFEWVSCDRGCIMLIEPDNGMLLPACRVNRGKSSDTDRMQISKTILDYVIQKSEGVLTGDARSDVRFESAPSVVSSEIREAICVPLQGRYSTLGAIYIDTKAPELDPILTGGKNKNQSRFNEDHLKLMVAIGHQAAVAIEDSMNYQGMIQAERMATMGKTMSQVSHHIKNILQGIRSGSYLVEEGLRKQDLNVVDRGWSTVARNTQRISDLVLDMLSYSKERELQVQPHDLMKCLDEVLALQKMIAEEKGVDCGWGASLQELAAEDWTVWFDPNALERALINVISNAIDAASEAQQTFDRKGWVKVDVRLNRKENRVAICVQDNGTGVEESDCERIFSMFESTKGSHGTGLGLPVSRKILQEHSGTLHVESTPGDGANFIMEWPIISLRHQEAMAKAAQNHQCQTELGDSEPQDRPTQSD